MHHKALIIYCCLGAQVVAMSMVIRREYFSPYPSDPTGTRMRSLKRMMYLISVITWIVIAIAQWPGISS